MHELPRMCAEHIYCMYTILQLRIAVIQYSIKCGLFLCGRSICVLCLFDYLTQIFFMYLRRNTYKNLYPENRKTMNVVEVEYNFFPVTKIQNKHILLCMYIYGFYMWLNNIDPDII